MLWFCWFWRTVTEDFDYCFAENGLTAIKWGKTLASQSFIKWLGEEKYKKLVKFILHYIADMDIPIKRYVWRSCITRELVLMKARCDRGTFMEFRNGMVKYVFRLDTSARLDPDSSSNRLASAQSDVTLRMSIQGLFYW